MGRLELETVALAVHFRLCYRELHNSLVPSHPDTDTAVTMELMEPLELGTIVFAVYFRLCYQGFGKATGQTPLLLSHFVRPLFVAFPNSRQPELVELISHLKLTLLAIDYRLCSWALGRTIGQVYSQLSLFLWILSSIPLLAYSSRWSVVVYDQRTLDRLVCQRPSSFDLKIQALGN